MVPVSLDHIRSAYSKHSINFIPSITSFYSLLIIAPPWLTISNYIIIRYNFCLRFARFTSCEYWIASFVERIAKMSMTNVLLFLIFVPICYMAGEDKGVFAGITIAAVAALLIGIGNFFAWRQQRPCPHCLQRVPKAAAVCSYCTRDIPVSK